MSENHEGRLIHNGSTGRMEIAFDSGGYSDGLHCGWVIEAFWDDSWHFVRVELGRRPSGPFWYLVGLPLELEARLYEIPVRLCD